LLISTTYYIDNVCVHIPESRYSLCAYYLNDICIAKDSRFIEIDIEILIWTLLITESHINSFYPGLDLFTLAAEENLREHFLCLTHPLVLKLSLESLQYLPVNM